MSHRGRGVLALVVAAVVAFPACTFIGMALGSRADRGKPPVAKPVAAAEVEALKPGSTLEVSTRDGQKVSGVYAGLEWARPEEYARRYEAARQALGSGSLLPALGPGARLAVTSGKVGPGEYLGLGPGFVRFQEAGRSEPDRVDLDRVASLADAGGASITGERLRELASSGGVPFQAGLLMTVGGGQRVVPFEEVTSVSRMVPSHSGKKTGLLVGLAVDVALVAAVVVSASSMDSGPSCRCGDPGCICGSCPLVDSFDGRQYVLDAEPLGGATYEAAQRADTARLDRLVDAGGEYRLRLHNEQDEIDHVDALALRVVDHAPGTEVVPDGLGRLHAVSDLAAPTDGRDLRGARVAAALAASDGEIWLGNPYGRRSDVEADSRDGVELEYARPAGATSATLVVRAGATTLGARMLGAVLALHGRELPSFYARLNADPMARARFEQAREREVLPTVRVWDGRGWRVAGHVRDLPSLVSRDQALPLDLEGVPPGPVRLRIDGPPGLFTLDRAALAWSDAGDTHYETRVSLRKAVSEEDGRDLTPVLRDVDARRHTLRPGRDAVRLAFPVPPGRPGWARSVLVEASGYYQLLVPAGGEPRVAEFRRLVEEPGAVGRFVLDAVRDEARVAAAPREF